MDLGLAGKVALVTGASRGIGRAVLDVLIAEGVSVVACARDVSPLAGLDLLSIAVDLATLDGPGEAVDRAVAERGGLDLLVNNAAGLRLHFDGFSPIDDEDWEWAFRTSFMSAVRTTRAALPHLIARRGAIVNVSSLNAHTPSPGAPEYSAMKAALSSYSSALATSLAPEGVRVNTVSPGLVMTDMQTGPGAIAEQVGAVNKISVEQYVAQAEQAVPLGRFGTPEEIAAAIAMLLSPRAGYATGADLVVDGGLRWSEDA